ncbi:uncharacterized protein [Amphiura filiformis]|uniref:uncharacterized protein n=1 Tax=Amphiura filiformis TaxID=82378 RepID=UPI003B22150F
MTPVEKAPEESAPGEKAPIEKTPVEKGHVEEAPVEKGHEENAPVEDAHVKAKQCNTCGVMCSTVRVRQAHEEMHQPHLNWLQTLGGFEITAEGACKMTLKSKRTCPKCGMLCKSEEAYANHRLSHKNWQIYVKKFRCGWCKKTFNCPRALFTHAQNVVKRFINVDCPVCGERDDVIQDADIQHSECDLMSESRCKSCKIYMTEPQYLVVHQEFTHTPARDRNDLIEADARKRLLLRLGAENENQAVDDENDIIELPPPEVPLPPEILIQDDSDDENSQDSSDIDGAESDPLVVQHVVTTTMDLLQNKEAIETDETVDQDDLNMTCTEALPSSGDENDDGDWDQIHASEPNEKLTDSLGSTLASDIKPSDSKLQVNTTSDEQVDVNSEPQSAVNVVALDSNSYPCNICQTEFVQESSLMRHVMLMHSKDASYPCTVCNASFESTEKLELHEKTHYLGAVMVREKCLFCPKDFESVSEMTNHTSECHMENGFYICKICKLQYTTEQSLILHIRTESHKTNVKEFKAAPTTREDWHTKGTYCQVCKRMFYNQLGLDQHLLTRSHLDHVMKSKQSSDNLKKSPKRLQSNNFGTKVHHSPKKQHIKMKRLFTCQACNTSFTVKSHYKNHLGTVAHQEKVMQRKQVNMQEMEAWSKRTSPSVAIVTSSSSSVVMSKGPSPSVDVSMLEKSLKSGSQMKGPSQSPIVVNVFSLANANDNPELTTSESIVPMASSDSTAALVPSGDVNSSDTNAALVSPADVQGTSSMTSTASAATAPSTTTVPHNTSKGRLKVKKKRRHALKNCLHCKLCYKTFEDKVALIKHKKYWHKSNKVDSANKVDSDKKGKKVKKKIKDKKKLKKQKKTHGEGSKGTVERTKKDTLGEDADVEIITLDSDDDDVPIAPGQSLSALAASPGQGSTAMTVMNFLAEKLKTRSETTPSLPQNQTTVQNRSPQSAETVQNPVAQQHLTSKSTLEEDDEIILIDSDDDTVTGSTTVQSSATSSQTMQRLARKGSSVTTFQNPQTLQNATSVQGPVPTGYPQTLLNSAAKLDDNEKSLSACHCIGCESSFSSLADVALHMLTHNNSSLYTATYACQCEVAFPVGQKCKKHFNKLFDLFVHIDSAHKGGFLHGVIKTYASSIYQCHHSFCTMQSDREELVCDHMRSHSHQSGWFSCPHCFIMHPDFNEHVLHMCKIHGSKWFQEKDKLIRQLEIMVYGQCRETTKRLCCHVHKCWQFCDGEYDLALHMLEHEKSCFTCLYESCNVTSRTCLDHFGHIKDYHDKHFIDKFVQEYGRRTSMCHYSGCTKTLNKTEEFVRHLWIQHANDTASLVCPHCAHVSTNLDSHKTHILEEHTNRWHNRKHFDIVKRLVRKATLTPYICEFKECFQLFGDRQSLQNHVFEHFPWRCHNSKCTNARFTTRELLTDHIKKSARKGCTYDLKCHSAHCNKKFTNADDLSNHERTVHIMLPISCNIFGKESAPSVQTGSLQGRTHKMCQDCNLDFPTAIEYIKHGVDQHNSWILGLVRKYKGTQGVYVPLRRKTTTCQYCKKSFGSAEDVSIHEMTHKSRWKSFSCRWCGKEFYSKPSLAIHVALIIKTLQGMLVRNKHLVNISFKYVDKSLSRQQLTQEVQCTTCMVWFNTHAGFEKHKRPVHLDAISSLKEAIQFDLHQTPAKLPQSVVDVDAQARAVTEEEKFTSFFTRINDNLPIVPQMMQPVGEPAQIDDVEQSEVNLLEEPVVDDGVIGEKDQSWFARSLQGLSGEYPSQNDDVDDDVEEVEDDVEEMEVDRESSSDGLVEDDTNLSEELTYADTQGMEIMCESCFEHFDEMKELKKHMKDIHNVLDFKPKPKPRPKKISKDKYKCKKCPATFNQRKELKLHKEYHKKNKEGKTKKHGKTKKKGHVNGMYNCKVCHANFDSGKAGKLHVARAAWLNHYHDGLHKPVDCSLCLKHFKNDKQLQSHKIQAHSSGTKLCPICCKWVPNKKGLFDKHMRDMHRDDSMASTGNQTSVRLQGNLTPNKQHPEPPKEKQKSPQQQSNSGNYVLFKCSYCRLMFSKKNLLDIHEHQHSVASSYDCDICQMKFTQAVFLTRHKAMIHKRAFYECAFCKMRFSKYEFLDRHEQNKHGQPSLQQSSVSASQAAVPKSELPSAESPDDICIVETPVTTVETIDIVSSEDEETAPPSTVPPIPMVHCGYCTEVFSDANDMLKHQLGHTKLQIDLAILCKLKMSYGQDKPDAYFVIYD